MAGVGVTAYNTLTHHESGGSDFFCVVMWMERVYLTVFGVLAAAVPGVVLGERLEAAREADGALMSILGTVLLWVIAGVVILPNLGKSEGRAAAVCMGLLLVLPEALSRATERYGDWERVRKGRSLCMAAVLVLHHFPEGMAAGLGCVSQSVGANALCWAIVLHSIPETMLLVSSMHDAGFGKWGGCGAAAISGIVTAAGVLAGALI